MHKGFIKAASLFGALSVALGAFGAHALKRLITPDALNIFETAVRYQFYHVFALFIAGIVHKDFSNKFISLAGKFFIAGIVLFSGSLYLLTYIIGADKGYRWIGAITPVGGVCFIAGWLCLFGGVSKSK